MRTASPNDTVPNAAERNGSCRLNINLSWVILANDLLCKNLRFIPNPGTWGRVNSQIKHVAEDFGNLDPQREFEMRLLV